MRKFLWFLSLVCLVSPTLMAQSGYTIVAGKPMIKGTSNLHDWQCVVEKLTGSASIITGKSFKIQSLNLKMDVNSIKSVKEDGSYFNEGMDKNTYKALNMEKFPEITYTLVDISNVKTSGAISTFTATGDLTVKGKTNRVSFPAKAVVSGNKITFTAVTKLLMTNFDIKPPTALMGTIKTGDEVTIVINTSFAK